MSKKIKKISHKMKDLVKFIDSYKDDKDKQEMLTSLNEFALNNFFALKTKHRVMIAFLIIFKRYKFEHIKRI